MYSAFGGSFSLAQNTADGDASPAAKKELPQKLDSKLLPNALQLNKKVISGGLPEGDAAFQELQTRGVKTVISVDGVKPDVVTAHKYGMRYIHLPHGYDGVPANRSLELAKAVKEFPGPIYIHCHHGKHRSPAAAAVACITAGMLPPESGSEVLEAAGTSENYRGLYRSVAEAHPVSDQVLNDTKADFPEIAKLPPMAEAMVAIEHTHDHLKAIAASDWKTPAYHPDLDPSHEALLLKEHFVELLRTEAVKKEPAQFQKMLRESQNAAEELETALNSSAEPESRSSTAKQAFNRLSQNCATCHKQFRDVPLQDKI